MTIGVYKCVTRVSTNSCDVAWKRGEGYFFCWTKFFAQNIRYSAFVIVMPGFSEKKVTSEMIYRVYQVIYLISQIGKTDVLGTSRICTMGIHKFIQKNLKRFCLIKSVWSNFLKIGCVLNYRINYMKHS